LAVVVVALVAAACRGDSGDDGGGDGAPSGGGAATTSDLATACGDRIVAQTDWYPSGNHSALYELAGPGGEIDKKKGIYSNEIGSSGVTLEIRAGGPFIGFQGDVSILYQNTDITLGYVNTSEAAAFSKTQPVVGVVTPYDKNPQELMWNPEELDIQDFADIGKSGVTVLVFDAKAAWVEYMIGKGWLKREQIDGSYDGSPTRFVAENGNIVQQGFVTDEIPYYEKVLDKWKKPVDFLLLHDNGLEDYPQVISARPEVVEEKRDCLKALVPMIQQAQVDWANDPSKTNALLVELNEAYKAPASNSCCLDDNHAITLKEELISNGPDSTLGNFDTDRVQTLIDLVLPIYEKQKLDSFDPDVTPEQIATNEFIDPSIGLK
jgi:ABC-type nitrate/sulfonate/bicarbonate transport system substrate-binding protein